ncbi:aminomethyltransferase [Myxococcaceae bacterium]|nr:aminomethyltransferase [Myxococcaceae bacterium]
MTPYKRTPLAAAHRALGARMVEFGGFEMPVQYTSILEEHAAVRERAGLFDVSHMGRIRVCGPRAEAAVERLVTCEVASLRPGAVRYGCLCNESGGTVDDVTVYRIATDDFFFCVNAANVEKDHRWIVEHVAGSGVSIENSSETSGLLALQGPAAEKLLQTQTTLALAGLRRFRFAEGRVDDRTVLVSRTGYTGSDGFEIYCGASDLEALWAGLLEAGAAFGLVPAGLGARDTLRLEAALPLYGHELDDETSPLEAGLDRFVKLDVGGFIGCEAIRARKAAGHVRALAGFILEDPGVARAGYVLSAGGRDVGVVTSGAPSPTLGRSIGLGWLPPALSAKDTAITVRVRARELRARVVETPFVRKVDRAGRAAGRN